LIGVPVESRDAEILLRLHAFEREERRVDMDAFDGQVGPLYGVAEYRKSLAQLEKLGCISCAGGAYVLHEDILVTESH
jgi:hypothetical protein